MKYRIPGEKRQNGSSLEVFTQPEFIELLRHGGSESRYYIPWAIIILFIGVEIYLWGTKSDHHKDPKKNRSTEREN
jgi:hypothetical protein